MNKWLADLARDGEPCIDECVTMLGASFKMLNELQDTPQDPQWHAEGNVYIHTGMVLDALYTVLRGDASHIRGERRQALILAALLHDIAKPGQTKETEINGTMRIVTPRHEEAGRSYLAFKFMDLPLPFSVVWTVLGLVGEHHMPKRLVIKNASRGEYLSLSRRVDTELLFWLEVADMKGRICPDKSLQLQYLEEFQMFAQEYGVWGEMYFPKSLEALLDTESEKARRYIQVQAIAQMQNDTIVQEEEAIARSFSHKDNYAHLVLLCGPSGSGKSTYVSRHLSDYVVISLDEIRAEVNGNRSNQKSAGQVMSLAKERLKVCLRNKQNVVWDATNVREDFRKIIADFGRDYNALITLVVFLNSEKTLLANNATRSFPVPVDVLQKQIYTYQFPLVHEAHEYIVVGEKGRIMMDLSS